MQLDITFPCQYCSNDIIVIELYFYCNGEGLFEHEGVSMKQKITGIGEVVAVPVFLS